MVLSARRRLVDAGLLLAVAANLHHVLVAAARWTSARLMYRKHGRAIRQALLRDVRFGQQ